MQTVRIGQNCFLCDEEFNFLTSMAKDRNNLCFRCRYLGVTPSHYRFEVDTGEMIEEIQILSQSGVYSCFLFDKGVEYIIGMTVLRRELGSSYITEMIYPIYSITYRQNLNYFDYTK